MIYLLLADGFEDIEALTPLDVFRRTTTPIMTVGIGKKKMFSKSGLTIECDTTIEQAVDPIDGVIIPGGIPGADNIDAYPETDKFLARAFDQNAVFGAICAGPMVLGKRGYLKGHRATVYPGYEEFLIGAEITGARVVRDGNFITGIAMSASLEFALALLEALSGKDAAEEVARRVLAV
jgi:4-methyl-5(b-hydroxyethyl)-thiazole monophosphate biosynthesis